MSTTDKDLYKTLRFLVIDDQPAARQSLRTCAQTMGAFSVDLSPGYQDAIGRIRRSVPDVVLCDFNLGDDRSGQQLLEEVRRHELLPEESVFIMVTAEQAYENVVAAVELGPDDYIIKPFSPDRLKFRLDRALQRKHFFRPFYVARREMDFDTAEAFIAEHLESEAGQPYRFDLMRQNAELQLARGSSKAAVNAFDAILSLHPFPWARAGKARALLHENRLQDARSLVDEVVSASPLYFDASDLKARICIEMGDYGEAQRTVAETSKRTARNYRRKRLLADAALLNGDAATAREAISDVLANDSIPGAISLSDRFVLARSYLQDEEFMMAETVIREIRAQEMEAASLDEKASHQALLVRIEPESARPAFIARREMWTNEWLGATAKLDLLHAAFELGDHELACTITQSLFARDQVRQVFRPVHALFERNGLEERFREMQKQAALEKIRRGETVEQAPGMSI